MREIKFRAWDKTTNDMYQNVIVACGGDYVILEYNLDGNEDIEQTHTQFDNTDGDVVIMQFTGLLDKNGKEIYEGDIISCGQDEFFEMSYYADTASFCANGVETGKVRWIENREHFRTTDVEINLSTSEVVGNIYENQELLK